MAWLSRERKKERKKNVLYKPNITKQNTIVLTHKAITKTKLWN